MTTEQHEVEQWTDFDEWCDAVDAYFKKHYDWTGSYTKDTGRECWRRNFDDGETPEDAALSEIEHWEE